MKEYPLDTIIRNLKEKKINVSAFLQFTAELEDTIRFTTSFKRIATEIESYETLVLKILRPRITKESRKHRYKQRTLNSVYFKDQSGKPLKNIPSIDTYKSQFIQMSYIGIFHKIENAEKELLKLMNKSLDSNYTDLKEIDFAPEKNSFFIARDRLRVLANCMKHNQNLASSQVCSYYDKCTLNEPIQLDFRNLKKDLSDIKKYYWTLASFLSAFASRKSTKDLLKNKSFEMDAELKSALLNVHGSLKKVIAAHKKTP